MIKETKQNKPKPKTFLENSFKKPSLSCSYYSTSKITNATSLNTHYDNPYIGEEVEFYKKKAFSFSFLPDPYFSGRVGAMSISCSNVVYNTYFFAALNCIFIFLIRGVRTSYNQ